ncbi:MULTISPECIES: hypothetical protein [unclassified Streptomyces]|uniref:hypothetical protein n=1 Tax=unclassified Streptomyces TaxID=2593676 RepID=UPI002DDAC270|nr:MULTISPECIES: hypothetical protein [unclassified Streptomyces]WSS46752.1 hypothetical protein OG220_39920 [Streptomyces sp. NBC_01187]WSA97731.1 hypothetical protein OIE63_40300 [Streptomyces sp. NBC_01795]WSB82019.1 hypothetical protein OHB04_40520 [Streptomyces sp. NBC_01775]WSS17994.1 hypothetical protein OG533_39625 [Streptomyces sp. NBC_01186]WSS47031.1 hypothetical protein OG220_41705 [Streptomyces sp. NBC_01187]
MPEATSVQALTVTGTSINTGDSINVGGIPLTVIDVRDVAGGRKRIEFCDGNVFVLGRHKTINIVRSVQLANARPRIVRWPGETRQRR